MDNTNSIASKEFQQVQGIISLHRLRALQTVNNENLLAAWEVGAFVSTRLKNSAWGSKNERQLIPKEVLQRSLEEFTQFLNLKKK
jgi:hypothetical protein